MLVYHVMGTFNMKEFTLLKHLTKFLANKIDQPKGYYIPAMQYNTVIQLLWLLLYLLYSVLIIVDTSTPVASHIIRLQEDLKLLLQQQLPLVHSFNMIRFVSVTLSDQEVYCYYSFNSDYEVWRSELVEPSPDTLAEAWM